MKRLGALIALVVALGTPSAASAHPLGNFTVNRYGEVSLSGDAIYVRYVLDLAEIPTFQEGDKVRAAGFSAEAARGLILWLDGRRAVLVPLEHKLTDRPGAGGLKTLRFEAIYSARLFGLEGTRELVFQDTNFPGRVGWREIVVRAERGARLESSSVAQRSVSGRLRSYPDDLLRSPLDVRSASAAFRPGSSPGIAPVIDARAVPEREGGRFESLIAADELSAGFVFVALLIAAFWGAAHALTPGHGKAIVAGYLVGSRGRPRDAVLLGLIVTLTHTAGVFALGAVTLLLSQFVVPERLYPWLTVASGMLVVVVGASVLAARVRHAHHHHDHHHHHDRGYGARNLLGVGVAAGLLPCPSALVVLLSAIALHRIGLGLALILAFSLGLAATITAIGLVAVLARRAFSRISLDGRLVRALPAVSALAILVVGLGITVNALPEVL
jgi:nickel/cobalt exporter